MHLPTLDDETLLRHAQADLDPLTSTPLEIELLKRFEALLDTIVAAGIDDAETLKERLARADEFDAIAKDAGDLFARLNTLATKEQS